MFHTIQKKNRLMMNQRKVNPSVSVTSDKRESNG